ncbi:MAG: DUF1015 domain-containing protein [Nitrospirae bacterium]|nr:DUF1015 domain-containing protein [Nitrospirota bacterium]
MAEIIPFRGALYNTQEVSGEDVVAPPYDIITPEYKEHLYSKSPYNIVRIDFGKELENDSEADNKYTRAAAYLNSWLESKILLSSKNPAFYVYGVDYRIKDQTKRLRGLFALVKIEELGKGSIYPHECTHSKPKADRLSVIRACNGNISPIFSLYNSPERKASEVIEQTMRTDSPYIEAKDADGAVHRLWIIEDKRAIEIIKNDISGRSVFIADGHHRYETALEFQKEMKFKGEGGIMKAEKGENNLHPSSFVLHPYDYVLMFLANISDEGLTILPAHRLVKNVPDNTLSILSKHFDMETILPSTMEEKLFKHEHAIGFFQRGDKQQYLLHYRDEDIKDIHPALRALDVTVLHELIFNRLLKVTDIEYEMDIKETMERVNKGLYDAAFFLNPTRVKDVERVAISSVRMPPKSTYFYPKLLTGMVIYKFSG